MGAKTLGGDPMPACPWCGTAKHVYEHGEREFFCRRCGRLFDRAGLDEGGNYYSDPTKRIEKEESWQRAQSRSKTSGRSRS